MPCLVDITRRPALFRMEIDKEWIWGRKEVGLGEAGRSGGEGGCGWDALSKRRIN